MAAPAMLAKAIFDNLADAPDELSFRRGDIVSVLEQDVDGLIGWWLCSLHGRQGIAPGNRLQEIKRRVDDEHQMQPSSVFNFEVADYDVPRSQEGEDYDVPRCVTSPNYSAATNSELEDYAVPKGFIGQATLQPLAGAKLAESHHSYYLPPKDSLVEIFMEESSVSDQGNGAVQSQDNYDIPPKGTDDDLADTVKCSIQGNSASLDQGADDVGELYDIPSMNVSSREIVVNKSSVVTEDKRIYTEIYDILPTHAEDDNMVHLQQSSHRTPADVNKSSTPQEKHNSHKATKSVKSDQVSTSWSQGERHSVCSTDSVKLSSEDDDYVDYQEIYGDGKEKEVNLYDVPVQAIPFPHERDIQNRPTTKRTQISILQRINMTAVKGIKLDPAGALQRLTKLEQAVNGTVQKLLSFVTSTWRDPDILNSQLADIRDVSGKAKVALRLLTEFALSSLVNAQLLPTQELSGKLSRAVEPLLETYYSVKLALQRLDEQDWKTPLRKVSNTHDDLDLIMVYTRSVPENSHKLASVIRTGATSLYKMTSADKKCLDLQVLNTSASQTMVPNRSTVEQEKSCATTMSVIPSVMDAKDASFKPKVHGTKWSPTTVHRICGMNPVKTNGDGISIIAEKTPSEDNALLTLPYRLLSSVEKTTNFLPGEGPRSPPAPPQRKDSGDKCHHLRQKSVDKFPAAAELTSSEAPGPPPKPKLDRKRASRKSYKIPLFSEQKHAQKEVVLREHKGSDNEPTTPRRKCNSDPVPIQESLNAELSSVEEMLKRQSILQIRKQKSLHISDSDLPQSLKQLENTESLPVDEAVGSRSFRPQNSACDVLQHRPLSTILKGGNRFMVSLNDRELLEFYKYEIDAQLFVLGEAIKGFFATIEKNESPKVFVSSSKFIVLSAHKFVLIGDTLSSKISSDDLRSRLEIVTSQLSNSIKTLVNSTKSAALQYPATNAMREMSDCVLVVNDTAIELHKVVKETNNST